MTTPPLTWLYVPGDRPDRFDKALASGADVVIIDLEDAVAPAHKGVARANARAYLATARSERIDVRVNDLRTEWGAADCAAISDAPGLGGVRVPKVERDRDVAAVRAALGARPIPLHCLIETARGVEAAFEIAIADPLVRSIALGEADLRSALGVDTEDGLLWSRGRIVVAARAAGLPAPAMSVYADIEDLEGLRDSCRRGRALGFLGRAAIHPRQLPVIAEAFIPTDAEIAEARTLLDALVSAGRQDVGVAVLPNGRFVDRAMIEAAERVIALAARRGM